MSRRARSEATPKGPDGPLKVGGHAGNRPALGGHKRHLASAATEHRHSKAMAVKKSK